jgi:hypothetical protein
MKPGRKVVENVAREIAATYDHAQCDGSQPTFEDVHAQLKLAFTDVPPANLMEIAQRTRELLLAARPHAHRVS